MINQHKFQSMAVMVTCAVLVGCAHGNVSPVAVTAVQASSRSGDVGVTDISEIAAPSGRLVLAENETFFLPLPELDNAPPAYPQPLLAQRLPPQVVCLQIAIGTHGEVMTVLPLAPAAKCPADDPGVQAAGDRRFSDAARDALLGWRFDAAFRCEYPNESARLRQDCTGGREFPQAISLVYRFIFEQRDGRGSVRQSATPND